MSESDLVIYEVSPRAPADAVALPWVPAGADPNSAAAAAKR